MIKDFFTYNVKYLVQTLVFMVFNLISEFILPKWNDGIIIFKSLKLNKIRFISLVWTICGSDWFTSKHIFLFSDVSGSLCWSRSLLKCSWKRVASDIMQTQIFVCVCVFVYSKIRCVCFESSQSIYMQVLRCVCVYWVSYFSAALRYATKICSQLFL